MRKYKEEYVGRTRLTQPDGSQVVTVSFPNDVWPGRKVKVLGTLTAAKAKGFVIEAANQAEAEDQQFSAFAEVNARRGE